MQLSSLACTSRYWQSHCYGSFACFGSDARRHYSLLRPHAGYMRSSQGFNSPAVRASAGFTLFMAASYCFRKASSTLKPVSGYRIVLYLTLDPDQLFDPSFQLVIPFVRDYWVAWIPFMDRFTHPVADFSEEIRSVATILKWKRGRRSSGGTKVDHETLRSWTGFSSQWRNLSSRRLCFVHVRRGNCDHLGMRAIRLGIANDQLLSPPFDHWSFCEHHRGTAALRGRPTWLRFHSRRLACPCDCNQAVFAFGQKSPRLGTPSSSLDGEWLRCRLGSPLHSVARS